MTVTAGGHSQTQVDNARADFLSQDTRLVHAGVGTADRATVTVRWPDGTTTRVTDVQTDQRLVVSRDGIERSTPLR